MMNVYVQRYKLYEGNADIAVADNGMCEVWVIDMDLLAFLDLPLPPDRLMDCGLPPLESTKAPSRCNCGLLISLLPATGICTCGRTAIV
ncbi:Aste57867_19440 [Aphanomyces stellatus]|uniref:Aste57867_19440 protein n=1 Tax=Aphanomyces stellatus TaxID=120398 RepID=A0A485LE87_9STRA|nr:hypothetical protein As57867_019376 [Aphanomyces stellatus]VFT96153.1 Aste57867_19440 [Aphanomyces stellatus]